MTVAMQDFEKNVEGSFSQLRVSSDGLSLEGAYYNQGHNTLR